MIDRTADFLKALKKSSENENVPQKASILVSKTMKQKTTFGKSSKEIVSNITKLRDFLLENRHLYIGGIDESKQMSDRDRDKIDVESENCMKMCSESLTALKRNEMPSPDSASQLHQHKKNVIEMIEKYLKSVCQVYSEQRAMRVKKVVDKKRISKLQTDLLKNHTTSDEEPRKEIFKSTKNPSNYLYDSDDELSPEEEELFAQENALLLNDMNSLVDEVKVIEGKVVEIARLQKLFSEQVFEQESEIELVAEKIVESSENVKDGNEELREAIKNNAGFRVWILFFLVMCSFSLLFLEWYS